MQFLVKINDFILDTLFPVSCISCGKNGEWICEKCLKKIPLKNIQVCPYCEKRITPNGRTCFECKKKYSLDGLLVGVSYKNHVISKAIHIYKYRFAEKISEPLGKIILKSIQQSEMPLPDLIISIPLHPRRLRWRGFNQSQLLAEYLEKNITPGFSIEVGQDLIERIRYTQPQMKLKNNAQRKKNIEKAFSVNRKNLNRIKNKRILLIDDVITTGATIFECAKVLKKSGAKEVFAAVIARQGNNQ